MAEVALPLAPSTLAGAKQMRVADALSWAVTGSPAGIGAIAVAASR
jgi:hypothetical protein